MKGEQFKLPTIYDGTGIRWQPLYLSHLTFNRHNEDEPGLLVDLPSEALRLYILLQTRSGGRFRKLDLANAEVRMYAGIDKNRLEPARRILREFKLIGYEPADGRKERYIYEIVDPRSGGPLTPTNKDGDDYGLIE